MDPLECNYYQNLIDYLEETQNSKYLAAKQQILTDDFYYDKPVERLKLLAQTIFMEYDPEQDLYIYDSAEPLSDDLLQSKMMIAVNPEGDEVVLSQHVGSRDQNVYKGLLYQTGCDIGIPVVVKWVSILYQNIQTEIDNWIRFRDTGAQTPWFDGSFHIYGYEVFVMEELDRISRDDDAMELGIQITEQLRHLHTFACHSDIKPGNIMKSSHTDSGHNSGHNSGVNPGYSSEEQREKYYIIDLGSISDRPLHYGYVRSAFTYSFTSQVRYERTIITPKYDLLELGFILNWMTYDTEGWGIIMTRMININRERLNLPQVEEWWRLEEPSDENIYNYYQIIQAVPETGVTSETYRELQQSLTVS